jgi:hypothetical protein
MEDAILLRTADRNLRRQYAGDIAGLTTFADGLASASKGNPVTVTGATFDGGGTSGVVTMPPEIWLAAAEELLADPTFNPDAIGPRAPRVLLPDYSCARP